MSFNGKKFDRKAQLLQAENFQRAQSTANVPHLNIPPQRKQPLLVDMRGNELTVGANVARASLDKPGTIAIQKITDIVAGKVFLDSSKQAIKFPSRLLLI